MAFNARVASNKVYRKLIGRAGGIIMIQWAVRKLKMLFKNELSKKHIECFIHSFHVSFILFMNYTFLNIVKNLMLSFHFF